MLYWYKESKVTSLPSLGGEETPSHLFLASQPPLFRVISVAFHYKHFSILAMAGLLHLPTISTHDLASNDSENSCYVTVEAKVYDVTSFLSDHPGGGDLILQYGGKDVSEIMDDELSHIHSETSYEILNDNLIGFVANKATVRAVEEHHYPPNDIVPILPKATEVAAVRADDIAAFNPLGVNDLTKEVDCDADFEKRRFLDLNKPLLPQVWYGGFSKDFYLEQVYRPRYFVKGESAILYYTKGESAPLFGNFLKPLSMTAWYVVPLIWLPPTVSWIFVANQGMRSVVMTAQYAVLGLFLWSLVEYWAHRAVHKMDRFVVAL